MCIYHNPSHNPSDFAGLGLCILVFMCIPEARPYVLLSGFVDEHYGRVTSRGHVEENLRQVTLKSVGDSTPMGTWGGRGKTAPQ